MACATTLWRNSHSTDSLQKAAGWEPKTLGQPKTIHNDSNGTAALSQNYSQVSGLYMVARLHGRNIC